MKHQKRFWLLIAIFSMLFATVVSAVIFEDVRYARTSGNFIGSGGFSDRIVNMYADFSGFIDFFIYFLIFAAVLRQAFSKDGKHNNALTMGVSLALTLSLILFQAQKGVSLLADYGGLALALLLVLLPITMWTRFYGYTKHKGWATFWSLVVSLALFIVGNKLMGGTTLFDAIFGEISLFYGGPFSQFAWATTAVIFVVLLIGLLFRRNIFQGRSGIGGGRNSRGRGSSGRHGEVQDLGEPDSHDGSAPPPPPAAHNASNPDILTPADQYIRGIAFYFSQWKKPSGGVLTQFLIGFFKPRKKVRVGVYRGGNKPYKLTISNLISHIYTMYDQTARDLKQLDQIATNLDRNDQALLQHANNSLGQLTPLLKSPADAINPNRYSALAGTAKKYYKEMFWGPRPFNTGSIPVVGKAGLDQRTYNLSLRTFWDPYYRLSFALHNLIQSLDKLYASLKKK